MGGTSLRDGMVCGTAKRMLRPSVDARSPTLTDPKKTEFPTLVKPSPVTSTVMICPVAREPEDGLSLARCGRPVAG